MLISHNKITYPHLFDPWVYHFNMHLAPHTQILSHHQITSHTLPGRKIDDLEQSWRWGQIQPTKDVDYKSFWMQKFNFKKPPAIKAWHNFLEVMQAPMNVLDWLKITIIINKINKDESEISSSIGCVVLVQ